MSDTNTPSRHEILAAQLAWFVRLRWLAAGAVLLGCVVDALFLGWYAPLGRFVAVGAGILVYNTVLGLLLRQAPTRRRGLLLVEAWAQIALDMTCLTLLCLWTGGAGSPLLGFYVFHMVIACLLLRPWMAYVGAAGASVLLASGLVATGQWPGRGGESLVLLGWFCTLGLTAYLANHIVRHLRERERRVFEQSDRISSMSDQLSRQRRAMVQHEKMVAMGQLSAGVAHEIANPLACIDSMLQLLERYPERANLEIITRLREQIKRIHAIVRQLTTFSHPDQVQWSKVAPGDLINRALQLVQFDKRSREIEIRREIADDVPAVRIQVHALEQVLLNLLLNAIDAMADISDPKLTIRAGCQGSEWFIEVADNGHGISPEHKAHLFEPFFTTKPVGKGTGLGLAIAYSAVENHGGRLEVESDPGQGARFRICVPVDGVVSDTGIAPGGDSRA